MGDFLRGSNLLSLRQVVGSPVEYDEASQDDNSHVLSSAICEEVAQDFIDGSGSELKTECGGSVVYIISNDEVNEYGDAQDRKWAGRSHITDYIGGVVFSLAENGMIPAETATIPNTTRILFYLGRLSASEQL